MDWWKHEWNAMQYDVDVHIYIYIGLASADAISRSLYIYIYMYMRIAFTVVPKKQTKHIYIYKHCAAVSTCVMMCICICWGVASCVVDEGWKGGGGGRRLFRSSSIVRSMELVHLLGGCDMCVCVCLVEYAMDDQVVVVVRTPQMTNVGVADRGMECVVCENWKLTEVVCDG